MRPKLLRSHTTSESRVDSWPPSARVSPKHSDAQASEPGTLSDLGSPLVLPDPVPAVALVTSESTASGKATQLITPHASSGIEATAEAQKEAAGPLLPPPISPPEQLEFLLVDDNAINLKILSSYMKKLNYKYNTACDGQEAVETFLNSPPGRYSCVFMDISMPVMDGFEATRRIRAFERETRAPKPAAIFALSGLASAEAQQEAFASGIDLFLAKPVKLKELSSILTTRGLL